MTPQQQPPPDQPDQFRPTGDELGAAWGIRLSQALIENITLDKLLAAQNKSIEEMAETEKVLSNRIQELEAEVAKFTNQEADLVDHIQDLETKLSELKADRGRK